MRNIGLPLHVVHDGWSLEAKSLCGTANLKEPDFVERRTEASKFNARGTHQILARWELLLTPK